MHQIRSGAPEGNAAFLRTLFDDLEGLVLNVKRKTHFIVFLSEMRPDAACYNSER